MSNYLAISTVSVVLRQILVNGIQADTGAEVTATFEPPRDGQTPQAGKIGLNVYLYRVDNNPHARNFDLPTRGPGGQIVQRPCVALDLHYLLSFSGDESSLLGQRALGSAVHRLHAQPVFAPALIHGALDELLPGDPLAFLQTQSDLEQALERVRITPIPLSLEDLSKLWSVFFQTSYRLSAAYQASLVTIEADEEPVISLPVRQPEVEVRPAVDGLPLSPDALPDLLVWYRSDAGVTYADGTAEVTVWADLSGNGHDAVPAAPANAPIFVGRGLGDKPVVRFDGTDDALDIGGLTLNGTLDRVTVAAVVRSDSATAQVVASFDRSEYFELTLREDGSTLAGWATTNPGDGLDVMQPDRVFADGGWHLVIAEFEATALPDPDKVVTLDGRRLASDNVHNGSNLGDGGASSPGRIGAGFGPQSGWHLDGDLAELAVWTHHLTREERQGLDRYFNDRYSGRA